MLPEFTHHQLEQIGFNYVLSRMEMHHVYGEERKRALRLYDSTEIAALEQSLDELENFVDLHKRNRQEVENLARILSRFKDIRGIIRSLERTDSCLDETDFFELKNFAIDIEHLVAVIEKLGGKLAEQLPVSLSELIRLLNPDEQITRTFCIDSRYSPVLTKIRHQKELVEQKIQSMEMVDQELFNERQQIVLREKEEETNIKKMLTEQAGAFSETLRKHTEFLAEADFLLARSTLALSYGCSRPRFTANNEISLINAIHPQIDGILRKEGHQFTPITLALQQGANVLTGANMGGKTVALATATLNILLAHCGFYVFAETLQLPVLDLIFFLGQDRQSIQEGLSSFGAEIKQIDSYLAKMNNKRSFAALDEFARGTNPEEGELIMRALMQFINQKTSYCLAATHFSEVVQKGMRHFQVTGLKHVQLDDGTKARSRQNPSYLQELMDFHIECVDWDAPIPKDALHIAELMGMQEDFLTLVRQCYKENE